MLLPHPFRSKYAEMQPLNAGGGDGCTGGETGTEEAGGWPGTTGPADVGGWPGTTGIGVEAGGERVVVVIVEVEVVTTVETVLVVTTVGGW